MLRHPMTEAEARYQVAVLGDCSRILGPGMDVLDLVIDDRTAAKSITLRYRLDEMESTTVGRGDTVIEAHAALREALVTDRLRIGFAIQTDPSKLR